LKSAGTGTPTSSARIATSSFIETRIDNGYISN
jgi:hypothetical protein